MTLDVRLEFVGDLAGPGADDESEPVVLQGQQVRRGQHPRAGHDHDVVCPVAVAEPGQDEVVVDADQDLPHRSARLCPPATAGVPAPLARHRRDPDPAAGMAAFPGDLRQHGEFVIGVG